MNVRLRLATLDDVPLLDKWDREPHVIKATSDDPDAAKAFEDADWADEISDDDPASDFFVAEVDGIPIGAMQMIDPAMERTHYWGKDCPPNLMALDIWIGEKEYLGRGFGTQMMRLANERAFSNPKVEAIIIDPLASNKDAHRFYRRLGFIDQEFRYFEEEDYCLVMRLERANWEVVSLSLRQ